jgi:hypothetical protein
MSKSVMSMPSVNSSRMTEREQVNKSDDYVEIMMLGELSVPTAACCTNLSTLSRFPRRSGLS